MSDIIELLPESVSNQIAAGEVIQRPASVVKELLENAVDAGSTEIKLIIKDAGKTLIQVVDDGCGMSETDARLALERHATSKIRQIEDLFSIQTMGFRGEALASIAAVAQLEMKTKRSSDEVGVKIEVEGSEVQNQEPCACPAGTSIAVKNLFFNVPARRNFLKTDKVEKRHIINEFQRVALAHPDIEFSLKHNNTQVYYLPEGNLKRRVVQTLGKKYEKRIVPVEEKTDKLNVKGFIGKPDYAKKTRGEQFFFVNNRFIKNNYLNHAVLSPYDEIIPDDRYPLYVLFLDIDTEMIDINIHPTKQEIKFDDKRFVYAIVNAAVKRALGKHNITPSLDFDKEAGFEQMLNQRTTAPTDSSSSSPPKSPPSPSRHPSRSSSHWQKLYQETLQQEQNKASTSGSPSRSQQQTFEQEVGESASQNVETKPYQLHQRYIISHIKSGVMIIDQQAAHERILFERYMKAVEEQKMVSQQQLFPQKVNFSPDDYELVQDILPEIRLLGFDVEAFGQNTFVIHSLPADVSVSNEQQVFENLVEQYKNHMHELQLEKREGLALTMARLSSVKKGKVLEEEEMEHLIDQLFGCESPYFSPTGRPTFVSLTLDDLAKQFEANR